MLINKLFTCNTCYFIYAKPMCFDVLNRKTDSFPCAFPMKMRVKPKLFSLKLKIKM